MCRSCERPLYDGAVKRPHPLCLPADRRLTSQYLLVADTGLKVLGASQQSPSSIGSEKLQKTIADFTRRYRSCIHINGIVSNLSSIRAVVEHLQRVELLIPVYLSAHFGISRTFWNFSWT
ncbi:hypothetical protein Zmor_003873 [Zophobas morio]|uniref:Uncharacterized protein n=1 Tax=Zophobas morio TaxID=2755281 RepID=A0AA38HJN8_9CUCU|nr:hypothetical protein Zmor_003873 [Zophobas morio]